MADTHERLLDRRVFERNIRKGLVTQGDYDQYIAGLTDVEGNAESVPLAKPQDEPQAAAEETTSV